MVENKHYSTLYLIVRSLLPSVMSFALCIFFSLILVGVHLLLLSLNIGTSLPTVLDGQWGVLYTNNVVQPLETLFNNLVLNNVLVIILWGLVGLATYFLCEYTMHLYHSWRQAEQDIQMQGEQAVVYHAARRSFVTTVLWRSGVLIISATIFIVLQPLLQRLLSADPEIVVGKLPVSIALYKLLFATVGWSLIFHGVVVFLRLFLMRTRLFGDPAIE